MNAPSKISQAIRAHDEQMLDNEPAFSQLENQLVASQFKCIEEIVATAMKRPDHDPLGSINPLVADQITKTCRVAIRALTGEWGPGYAPSAIRRAGAQAAWEGKSAAYCPYMIKGEDGKIWMQGYEDARKRMVE